MSNLPNPVLIHASKTVKSIPKYNIIMGFSMPFCKMNFSHNVTALMVPETDDHSRSKANKARGYKTDSPPTHNGPHYACLLYMIFSIAQVAEMMERSQNRTDKV